MQIATNKTVNRSELLEFIRGRHHCVLLTIRADGRPQSSLVTMGVSATGQILVSTYPERAKAHNLRRDSACSVIVMSDSFGGEWIHIYGTADVVDLPDSVDGLVEYFRVISGEHPDWDEYRDAMVEQGKSLIRITIDEWGPVASGGFPARLAQNDQVN